MSGWRRRMNSANFGRSRLMKVRSPSSVPTPDQAHRRRAFPAMREIQPVCQQRAIRHFPGESDFQSSSRRSTRGARNAWRSRERHVGFVVTCDFVAVANRSFVATGVSPLLIAVRTDAPEGARGLHFPPRSFPTSQRTARMTAMIQSAWNLLMTGKLARIAGMANGLSNKCQRPPTRVWRDRGMLTRAASGNPLSARAPAARRAGR